MVLDTQLNLAIPTLSLIIAFFSVKFVCCITSSHEKSYFVFVAGPKFCRWAWLDLNLAKYVIVADGEADVVIAPFACVKSIIDNFINVYFQFIKISTHQIDVP